MNKEEVLDVITEEFSVILDVYAAADNDEVMNMLMSLREDILERLGINE